MTPKRNPDVRLCIALRNVLQRSRLEGKMPNSGHHEAAVRAAKGVQRRLDAPLPRAVRELLRDVVLLDGTGGAPMDMSREYSEVRRDLAGMSLRAARILGTTPGDIVAKARKAGRR